MFSCSIRSITRRVLACSWWGLWLVEGVRRAGGASAAGVSQDVCVDHGCLDVFMPEELLDGADIVAGDQRVGSKATAL